MSEPLAAVFASSLREGAPPSSEAALRDYLASARARQPQLSEISDHDLLRHTAERCDARGLPPAEHAGDLLLALGCLRGLPLALTCFEVAHADVIARVLSRRRADALADDVAQQLRERLLVGRDGGQPQIASYRGTGPLRSWVAIASATQLAMARRNAQRRREEPERPEFHEHVIAHDPELQYLQQRYRSEVEQALVHALHNLGDRERVILRLQLGERLSLEQLAVMYAVDRATIARWLAKARRTLLHAVRLELRARTGAAEGTCEELLRLVQSQLDVSVLRHLR